MQKQHLLMVLFETNLLSNINTKALKKAPYLMPVSHLKQGANLMQGGLLVSALYAPSP